MSDADLRTHSALHVLKGAVQRVLGTEWTASVFVSGERGRLTVQAERKPTGEELRRIEELPGEDPDSRWPGRWRQEASVVAYPSIEPWHSASLRGPRRAL